MVVEVKENEAQSLLDELDEAIDILTIARSQRRLIFIKGVVRYIKSMAPKEVKEILTQLNEKGDF